MVKLNQSVDDTRIANAGIAVSVITPVYNAQRFLRESIESVLAQTFTAWELILVDDASQDQSLELIKQYQACDSRIRLIRLPHNSGAAKARNAGIERACGRYIAFLDADDKWYPDKLAVQLDAMRHLQLALSYTQYDCIDDNGKHIAVKKVPATLNYRQLLKSNRIGCSTAIYDSACFGKVFMPQLERQEDFALWLQLLKTGRKAGGIERSLGAYRLHPGSLSANKLISARFNWLLYFKIEKLGFFRSVWYFLHYASRGLRYHLSLRKNRRNV